MENDTENKYRIDSESYDTFDNITRLAKNLTLKDSKTLYNNESAASEELGRLLLKYYDFELTNEDIVSLVKIVNKYNKEVKNEITDDKLYKYSLGLNDDATIMVSNDALILRAIKVAASNDTDAEKGALIYSLLYDNTNRYRYYYSCRH